MVLGGQPFGTSDSNGGSEEMGITQLTQDVLAGPGNGSQAATIAPLAVTTGKLAGDAVTEAKLADDAVSTDKIVDAAVETDKLAPLAVTIDKLADDSVGTSKILDSAVSYDKMQDVVEADGAVLGATATGPVTEIPFKATARDIGAAASPAAVRAILGIRDIGDFRNWAVAQAKQRLGLTTTEYPQVVMDEPFLTAPGVTGSTNIFHPGTGAPVVGTNITVPHDFPGGWTRFSDDSDGVEKTLLLAAAVGAAPGTIIDLNSNKWYVAALIRFAPGELDFQDPGGGVAGLEMILTSFLGVGPAVGIKANSNNTKFGINGASGTFLPTSVDIDDAVHVIEWWGLGNDKNYISVDETTTVEQDLGTPPSTPCYPRIRCSGKLTGEGGNMEMDFGHIVTIVV